MNLARVDVADRIDCGATGRARVGERLDMGSRRGIAARGIVQVARLNPRHRSAARLVVETGLPSGSVTGLPLVTSGLGSTIEHAAYLSAVEIEHDQSLLAGIGQVGMVAVEADVVDGAFASRNCAKLVDAAHAACRRRSWPNLCRPSAVHRSAMRIALTPTKG